MQSGHITLPRPERDYLIEARSGAWSLKDLLEEAERLRIDAENATVGSQLPDHVDEQAISRLIAEACLTAWSG